MLATSVDTRPDTGLGLDPSGRVAEQLLRQLEPERFDPARIRAAVALFPPPRRVGQEVWDSPGLGFREGRTFRVGLAPGVVSVASFDAARRERALERDTARIRRDVDLALRRLLDAPLTAGGGKGEPTKGVIVEWSRKSRVRMVRAFGEVDWSALLDPARPLGMLTVSYPGDWLAVAPDGPTVKGHLRALQLRWKRATGKPLRGAWKEEFQERGAPHFHMLVPVPAVVKGQRFEQWFSETWAGIVGADWCGERCWEVDGRTVKGAACCERGKHTVAGTGVDFDKAATMTDPKRMAVYFLKHSDKSGDGKEYQHNVPVEWQEAGKGPGRFWGFWGMPKAVTALDLDVDDFITARRVLRKVSAGRARRIARDRAYWRVVKDGGAVGPRCACHGIRTAAPVVVDAREGAHVRRNWSLGRGGQMTGGFVMVNDGAAVAVDVARALLLARGKPYPVRVAGQLVDPDTGELLD